MLNTSKSFGNVDRKDVLKRWLAQLPPNVASSTRNMTQPIRGAALPMGFNRQPHYTRGMLLIGDAGGMVNPFNGEGIAYAMESASIAAEVVAQALARETASQRELALLDHPRILKQTYGGYYTPRPVLREAHRDPALCRFAAQKGLPHTGLMKIVLKLLANPDGPLEEETQPTEDQRPRQRLHQPHEAESDDGACQREKR